MLITYESMKNTMTPFWNSISFGCPCLSLLFWLAHDVRASSCSTSPGMTSARDVLAALCCSGYVWYRRVFRTYAHDVLVVVPVTCVVAGYFVRTPTIFGCCVWCRLVCRPPTTCGYLE